MQNYLIEGVVFLPMAAALIGYLIGRSHKRARSLFANIVTGACFVLCAVVLIQTAIGTADGVSVTIPYVCGMGLHFTLDGFRALYGTIAAFMWFMTTLFSGEYFDTRRNGRRIFLRGFLHYLPLF